MRRVRLSIAERAPPPRVTGSRQGTTVVAVRSRGDVTFPSLMTIPRPLLDASHPTGATHVAGVDGGATKTVAAVLELETFRVFLGRGGPANVDAVGVESAAGALETAMNAALA